MKRIRQYIARISRTVPKPDSKPRLALSATTSQSSVDEDATGLLVLQEGTDVEDERGLDFIFIHCLGGSRVRSWTKDGVCWPRDLLGREFPHARILTVRKPRHHEVQVTDLSSGATIFPSWTIPTSTITLRVPLPIPSWPTWPNLVVCRIAKSCSWPTVSVAVSWHLSKVIKARRHRNMLMMTNVL